MSLSLELGHIICFVFLQKTNYALASPINRIMSLVNESYVELFNCNSVESFSKYVNRNFFKNYTFVSSMFLILRKIISCT